MTISITPTADDDTQVMLDSLHLAVTKTFTLVPKLKLGNTDSEALASRCRKLELPVPNSQAGAWEPAESELISKLRLVNSPDINEQAPLAAILARHHDEMPASDLWQHYGGDIDAFYTQLKLEVGKGWIEQPSDAGMREKEAG